MLVLVLLLLLLLLLLLSLSLSLSLSLALALALTRTVLAGILSRLASGWAWPPLPALPPKANLRRTLTAQTLVAT